MATNTLPTLPIEISDAILSLATPLQLDIKANTFVTTYSRAGHRSTIVAHTADQQDLLVICARLRLSKYHRGRAIKDLNKVTISAALAWNHAPGKRCESTIAEAARCMVPDSILKHCWRLRITEPIALLYSHRSTECMPVQELSVTLEKNGEHSEFGMGVGWKYENQDMADPADQQLVVYRRSQVLSWSGGVTERTARAHGYIGFELSARMIWELQEWIVRQIGDRTPGSEIRRRAVEMYRDTLSEDTAARLVRELMTGSSADWRAFHLY